jgi:excisionase family DNA binding protein
MLEWNGDAVMTLEEAASFLKVSETTVYQLVRSGELKARKVGREWRILKSQLVEFLKQDGSQDAAIQDTSIQDATILPDEDNGGEYRLEDGQEKVALWLPISRAEKAKLIQSMTAKKTSMTELVMTAIRDFF